ncbi:MAG TPA: toll/interleukin-1 receptor domain-containing protein [Candidatus Binataceae bacterium]|nr:toll/interleukin-1 receptor domain-containing protein [Candidatus Binataceae bacterium]
MPGFPTDIFISYCHVDNHPIDTKGTLWVENFHRDLQGLVNTCVGRNVVIWRDRRLSGATVFSDEIADRLRSTAILVTIESPGYIESEWCTREREIFVGAAAGNGGLDIDNHRRIIRAAKVPVPLPELPDVLKPTVGFPLYSIDEQSGSAIDFLFDPRPEAEKLYRRALSLLAQSIADLLKQMRDAAAPRESSAPDTRTTVYLAETTSDLERDRTAIRLELEARGCVVTPRQPLPRDFESCTAMVRKELARADLSIHLLGSRYGLIPEGVTKSLIELQTDLAVESGHPGARRLVWIPRGLDSIEPQQRVFLERVRSDHSSASGFELLETSPAEFKTFLISMIERPAPPPPKAEEADAAEQELPHIYLVRDREDRESVAALTKFLFNQGFEVLTQADEGEEAELRQNHQENLKVADAVMIWWGHTSKVWLDYMMRDLDKARGLGRKSPFRATAVCIAAPRVPDKDEFMTHKAQVFKFLDAFAPEALNALIQRVKLPAHA